jgi:hypothetical protein
MSENVVNQHKSGTGQGRSLAFFLIAVVALFLFRSLWTYPVDHSDAIQKYFYAAEIIRSGDWSILLHNHHTLRWAAMLPQIALTWLLGTRYEVFYILPLLIFSLYVVLIIFSLRNILNLSQQLLLMSILLAEPLSLHVSNQYFVSGLGIFFAFVGILALVSQTKWQKLAVVLAGISFFIAYGAHVTYLSFAAGGFWWLMLFQRRPSRLIIFCATILTLLLIETLAFNYLSDWQFVFGRLEGLASSPHVGRNPGYDPVTFTQLLTRWLMLPLPHLLLCLSFFVTMHWLIVQKKRGNEVPAFIECTFLVGLCFGFAVTFAVYGIDPIRPVQLLLVRYLIPILPFASIMAVFMLSRLIAEFPNKPVLRAEAIVSLMVALILLLAPTFTYDFFSNKFKAFMWSADEQYTEFAELFRDGELNLIGRRRIVHSMIARFKYPVNLRNRETGLSVIELSPEALCVDELLKIPLRLNYEDCVE